jgi:hypothetical protein
VLSGEASLFDLGSSFVDEVHLPLFEQHFGSPCPASLLAETLRSVWLRSRHRGAGRFRLLSATFSELASDHRLIKAQALWKPMAAAMQAWLASHSAPATLALEVIVAGKGEMGRRLAPVLAWSRALDRRLGLHRDLPLWPTLARTIADFPRSAELVTITSLPERLIQRSWKSAGTGRPLARIWDDRGSARAPLIAAHVGRFRDLDPGERVLSSRFPEERVLVIGASVSDQVVARSIGAAFFPLIRGREDHGWARLSKEILPAFAAGRMPRLPGLFAAFLER